MRFFLMNIKPGRLSRNEFRIVFPAFFWSTPGGKSIGPAEAGLHRVFGVAEEGVARLRFRQSEKEIRTVRIFLEQLEGGGPFG